MNETGLEIRRGTIFDIFESQHSGVMSVTNSTVKVSNCVFKNTHGRHAGFATVSNSTFDLENSNFEGRSKRHETEFHNHGFFCV